MEKSGLEIHALAQVAQKVRHVRPRRQKPHIGPVRHTQREDASCERQRQAFDQQLENQVQLACPERRPNGEFPPAIDGATHEKVGYVGTRNQQHEADCREQHHQELADIADNFFPLRYVVVK